MKTPIRLITGIALVLWIHIGLFAQNPTTFFIHEDRVRPDGIEAYEAAAKDLANMCKRHDIRTMNWMTISLSDGRYVHVTPIASMAELDSDPWAEFNEKVGKEAKDALLSQFAGYTQHGDYTIRLREDLSHQPTGIDPRTEGQDYRRFVIWHVYPEKLKEAEEIGKKVRNLYARKAPDFHYRVYQNGFGQMGPYFQIAMSGTSATDHAKLRAETIAKLGVEYAELIKEIQSVSWKIEILDGQIRTDLSYIPSAPK